MGRRIGGVVDVGADLHDWATAKRDLVVRLVPVRIVGVRRVSHVRRDVHRAGDRTQELIARAAAGEHGALQLPAQPRTGRTGHRLAAHLLMVEQHQRADVPRRGLAGHRGQRRDARVRASQVIQPCRADELFAGPGEGAAGQVIGHHVMAEHVAGRDVQFGGEKVPEGTGLRGAQRPDGHQMLLRIELQPFGTQVTVEVDRQLRHPQHRPVHPYQPGPRAVRCADNDTASEAEVAIEPGIQQRAAVDLHAELAHPGPARVRARPHPQRRAVGVRPQQPERCMMRRARRNYPGEQRAAVHHGIAARIRRPVPGQRKLSEARQGQPAQGFGGGVVRRRRGIDEVDQIQGGITVRGHCPIIARPRTGLPGRALRNGGLHRRSAVELG